MSLEKQDLLKLYTEVSPSRGQMGGSGIVFAFVFELNHLCYCFIIIVFIITIIIVIIINYINEFGLIWELPSLC